MRTRNRIGAERARGGLLVALLLAPATGWGTDPAVGTGGAAFLKIGMGSTRAMSLGRAYVALAEGSDAMNWNPAGLALTQTREMEYSYMRYIQGIDAPLYAAYAHPLGRTVFGANVAYISISGFDVRDNAGIPLANDNVMVHDGYGTLSVARSFWYEKLFLGASARIVSEDNGGASRSTTVGDFGVLFKPNNVMSYGFSTQNFGGNQSRVYKVTRIGTAMHLLELVNVTLEASKPSDNGWQAGLGGEFILPEELLSVGEVSLRVGYFTVGNQGSILPSDRSGLYPLVGAQGMSFGVGLFTSQAFGYGIGLDYALVPMGALGMSDQISLKMKF